MQSVSRLPGPSRRLLNAARPLRVAGWLVLAVLIAGCDSSRGTSGGDRSGSGSDPVAVDPQLCRETLERAIDMLHPERLGISAERKTAAGILNSWQMQCGTADAPAADRALERLLDEETRVRVADPNFSSRDCDHVRTCFLLQETLDDLAALGGSELDRVVDVFYHVVRTVELVEELPDGRPQTPFETVLFGRGTVEDRTWVFAELVRQMRLDAVVVRPAAADSAGVDGASGGDGASRQGESQPLLVGVLLDGEMYLFDPALGLPVPAGKSPEDSLFVRVPATLSAAASDPEVLRRLDLDADRRYPVAAADLQSPRVELVGSSSFWAPRMKALDAALAGERSSVIYDPLGDDGSQPGAWARVAEAGGDRWGRDDIGVWAFPESRLQAFEALDRQAPQDLEPWLRAPFPIVSIDQTGQPQFGVAHNEVLKTRTSHVLGEFAEATMHYTALRGLERALVTGVDPDTKRPLVIPEEYRDTIQERMINLPQRQLHRRAAENAWFWLGLSQYQQQKFAAAIGTFGSYIEEHGSGMRTAAARELRAVCLAETEQIDAAVAQLRDLVEQHPEHPGRHGVELLIRRWENRAADQPAPATATGP